MDKRVELRRQQLDRQLLALQHSLPAPMPQGGWVRSIRTALGMSMDVFARRLGLNSRSSAAQIERGEVDETISVKRLRAAAEALGCDLAVVFIPKTSLVKMTEEQARAKVLERFERVRHSMVMEDQDIGQYEYESMVQDATEKMLRTGDKRIWE